VDKSLETVTFTIEKRTGNTHRTGIRLSFPVNANYVLTARCWSQSEGRGGSSGRPQSPPSVRATATTAATRSRVFPESKR
jgi:hypothetical protein